MIHRQITPPFGDDIDANNALADVLGLVAELAAESRKLTKPIRDARAENALRAKVRELHETICSRARSVLIPEDEFLLKGCQQLTAQTGRAVQLFIPGQAPPPARPDDELRRREAILLDAEILEQERLRRLNGARRLFADAQDQRQAAQRAVDARIAELAEQVSA